jgi:hypothetical protein
VWGLFNIQNERLAQTSDDPATRCLGIVATRLIFYGDSKREGLAAVRNWIDRSTQTPSDHGQAELLKSVGAATLTHRSRLSANVWHALRLYVIERHRRRCIRGPNGVQLSTAPGNAGHQSGIKAPAVREKGRGLLHMSPGWCPALPGKSAAQ